MPPFGIFNTEFLVLSAGIKDHLAIVVIALAGLALIFAGFLRHVVAMVMGSNDKGLARGESGVGTVAPIIVLAVILIVGSFYIPAVLRTLIISASSRF